MHKQTDLVALLTIRHSFVDTAEHRPLRVALSEHQLGKRSARKADVQLAQFLLCCKNGLDRRKTVQKESRVQGSGRRGAPSLRL